MEWVRRLEKLAESPATAREDVEAIRQALAVVNDQAEEIERMHKHYHEFANKLRDLQGRLEISISILQTRQPPT